MKIKTLAIFILFFTAASLFAFSTFKITGSVTHVGTWLDSVGSKKGCIVDVDYIPTYIQSADGSSCSSIYRIGRRIKVVGVIDSLTCNLDMCIPFPSHRSTYFEWLQP